MRVSLISTALAVLTTTSLAQNTNNTSLSNATCGTTSYSLSAPVNASATVPITRGGATQNWYLTTTLNDTQRPNRSDPHIFGFLSTPRNATGHVCATIMRRLLSPQSDGNGGCAGSLSQNCVDFLTRSVQLTPADAQAGRCPNLPSRDDLASACGDPLAQGYGGT